MKCCVVRDAIRSISGILIIARTPSLRLVATRTRESSDVNAISEPGPSTTSGLSNAPLIPSNCIDSSASNHR